MNKVDLTVIIPHYNIPDLLSRCLRSVPETESIQVVVVDDCSPNSANYYDEIPELSRSNVELYSTNQGGSAGRARNVGLEHAKGRWITFLDADDLFVDNVSDILEKYIHRNEEIVFFRTIGCMSENIDIPSTRSIYDWQFDLYFRTGCEEHLRYGFDSLWGKLIKKELIDQFAIRFDEVRYSNDVYFSGAIGVFAKCIYVTNEVFYMVTEREGSLTAGNMKDINELVIRYNVALRLQRLYDTYKIKYKNFVFAHFLNLIFIKDRRLFAEEFIKLSRNNKFRYVYCLLRRIYGLMRESLRL